MENYKKLQGEIRILKMEKHKQETQGRKKIASIKKKVEMISKKKTSLALKIREKEKEYNIAKAKINEISRMLRYRTLKPLNDTEPAEQ